LARARQALFEEGCYEAQRDRILTTHTGSLPHQPILWKCFMHQRKANYGIKRRLKCAFAPPRLVVRQQLDCGVDIVNDGGTEIGYATYVKDH
jgi:hypothetical protein